MTWQFCWRSCAAVALIGLVGAGTGLRAQTPAPPSAGDPGGQQPQETPTFRVAVDLVTTDVIVRDGEGQFVADLEKDDFEVFEDGVRQEVSSLVLVHGGRAYNQLVAPPPPPQEGIILPPPRPPADTAGRIFLIFIDDLHLDFRNTPRIKALFKEMTDTLIHEGDMFGIVSTGPSSLAIPLTYDRNLLQVAYEKIRGNGLSPSDILAVPDGAEGPSEVRYRAHVAFSTAYEILQNFEKITNRRKAFVYVSNGYDFDPFSDSRMTRDQSLFGRDDGLSPFARVAGGRVFADADLAMELAELTRQANRANTTIYSIDPRGLVGGPDMDEPVSTSEWYTYLRKSQDSLRVLAEETGGIAVVNQNSFDEALKRIDAETSDYYVLGYYSSNPDPTQRVRQIEVKVKKDGNFDLWYRKAYTLKPAPVPVTSER